ncbi:MAG: histidinol phosphate phosphatase [Roseiflexus castenholzii]|nr:MAG: histidinol phosphate phosphatase [Roseiflexus castenholzii]
MASETLEALREFAADLAWHAGRLTLRYFQTGITPDIKEDRTPVTIADREAEQVMRRMIEARYPHHSILGEEEGETRPGASHRWILDPIDGTKSFVQGVPLYGVLVGLERDGEAVVGAVSFPALGDFLTAARGQGCQWNGRQARVSQVREVRQATLLSSDAESMAPRGRLAASVRLVRTWGDAYGYSLVATGRAEIMLDPVMSVWDCAALFPIVTEAGGTFTDWNGAPTIHAGEAIGTNGLLLEQVLNIIRG